MKRYAPTVEILGVPIARLDPATALVKVERLYNADAPACVFYANAHTLNLASRNPEFKAILRRADLVLNDGSGVAIAARVYGQPFPANLNGSDFNPQILALAAERGWSSFFLGARPGVAKKAAHRLQAHIPNLKIAGVHDGYFPQAQSSRLAREIQASGAGVLMVAMGNPLQELWLERYLYQTGVRLGIGVGAFFDYCARVVPRAPHVMNRLGIEWLYRLAQEPRRLWRRYLIGNPAFLARVTIERLAPRR